jgi:uncharacterized membrane protein
MRNSLNSLMTITALLVGASACDSSRSLAPAAPAASVSATDAPRWTVVDLGAAPAYLPFGFSPISVSNIGEVIGQGRINGFTTGIAITPTGKYTPMRPLPGDVGTFAGQINVMGSTVGISVVDRAYTNRVIVTWDRQGNPTPIPGLPRSDGEDAFLINDFGVVAGNTKKFNDVGSGFVWHRSWPAVRELRVPIPGTVPLVADINNRGQIVGSTQDQTNTQVPVIWDLAGNFTLLPSPDGALFSFTNSINDHGTLVGTATLADYSTVAWIWTKSAGYKMYLPPTGYENIGLYAIDNAGRAYGVAFNADGTQMPLMIVDGRIITIPSINGGTASAIVSNTGIMVGSVNVNGVMHPTIWIPRR